MADSYATDKSRQEPVLVSRSYVESLSCPTCDGSGMITNTGPDPLYEPCQWCEQKHLILSGAHPTYVAVPRGLAGRLMSYARTYNLIDVAAMDKILGEEKS